MLTFFETPTYDRDLLASIREHYPGSSGPSPGRRIAGVGPRPPPRLVFYRGPLVRLPQPPEAPGVPIGYLSGT